MTFQGYPYLQKSSKKTLSGIACLWPTVSISHELALGAEVTVLNLQDEYVSVIELRFIFPFQQFIDLPGTLLS